MATVEQQQKLLKAKVAIMLYTLLGRVSERQEIDQAFRLIRMMHKGGSNKPAHPAAASTPPTYPAVLGKQ